MQIEGPAEPEIATSRLPNAVLRNLPDTAPTSTPADTFSQEARAIL